MKPFIYPPFPTRPSAYDPVHWHRGRFIVQPKYNGVRCMVHESGRVFSKTGKEFRGLDNYFPTWSDEHVQWADGEILSDDSAISLQTIAGLVNSFEPDEAQRDTLYLRLFDIVAPMSAIVRQETLRGMRLVRETPRYRVSPYAIMDYEQANTDFNNLTEHEEGRIYRHMHATGYPEGATNYVQKRKKFNTAEYKCLSVHEGLGKFKGMFGGAVLELPNGATFKCGGGLLTIADRIELWANPPIGKRVTVQFPYMSDDKVPLQAQWVAVRNYE